MGLISHQSVNNLIETPPDYDGAQAQLGYDNQQGSMQEMWQTQQQFLQQPQHVDQQYQQQHGGFGQWPGNQVEQEMPGDQLQHAEQQEGMYTFFLSILWDVIVPLIARLYRREIDISYY